MNSREEDEKEIYAYYEPPTTSVKSAIRVIQLLEFFYRHRQPARITKISKELEFPASSAKYLLESLVESGYLTFDKETKSYFPSILFTGVSSWLSEIYPSGDILRRIAREAHQATGELVSIAVQHDRHMRVMLIEMDGIEAPPALDFRARIPMIGSASGAIAMSVKSDAEVADIVERESRKHSPTQRKTQTEQILNSVRQVRQRGYALKEHRVNSDRGEETYIALAIPLPADRLSPPMALDVCGLKENIAGREAELITTMQAIAGKYRGELLR